MSTDLRQMVIDRDELGLERAFFDNECPNFFAVDWREERNRSPALPTALHFLATL